MTEVTITGMLYDKIARTTQNVVMIGDAYITGLTIGGGPIIPPAGKPPGIWGGPIDPYPDHGLPPWQPLPPITSPPSPPQPGDPTTPVPPPPGSAGWPVQNIMPPPYIVVNYPGIGPVIVAPPAPPEK